MDDIISLLEGITSPSFVIILSPLPDAATSGSFFYETKKR